MDIVCYMEGVSLKTLKTVDVIPVFVVESPKWDDMEENHLYISKEYKIGLHLCLCGCKEKVVTPFSDHIPYHWELVENERGVSIVGSILNTTCKSHYIITNNKANFV